MNPGLGSLRAPDSNPQKHRAPNQQLAISYRSWTWRWLVSPIYISHLWAIYSWSHPNLVASNMTHLTTFRSNRNWRPWRPRSRHLSGSAAKSGGNFCRQKEVLWSTPLGPLDASHKWRFGLGFRFPTQKWNDPAGRLASWVGGWGRKIETMELLNGCFFLVCWSIATLPRFFFKKLAALLKNGITTGQMIFFPSEMARISGNRWTHFFLGV